MTSLLTKAREDLPLFLFAHGMGTLVLNTFLGQNPEIADRVAGVIYSAPFFGMPDFVGLDFMKKTMVKILAPHLDEFTCTMARPIHKWCRDKQYVRHVMTDAKSPPYGSLGL